LKFEKACECITGFFIEAVLNAKVKMQNPKLKMQKSKVKSQNEKCKKDFFLKW
jgi:hypothetical protein